MSHYLDYTGEDIINMDMSMDAPTRVCICGSTWFTTIVQIGEDFEIDAYGLDGQCIECGTRVKLPCPVDHPSNV